MGMFDYLRCHYPLPGECAAEAATFHFQTKDLDCCLAEYFIDKSGQLMLKSPEEDTPVTFTGSVTLYGSNILAYHPRYTANGEDAVNVEYIAVFRNGALSEITQTKCEVSPAPSIKDRPPDRFFSPSPTKEEEARIQSRQNESLTGKTIFIRRNRFDDSPARETAVVAEDEHEVVARHKDLAIRPRHVVFSRSDRDDHFFDSPQEAQAHHENRQREIDERRAAEFAHHAALLAARKS